MEQGGLFCLTDNSNLESQESRQMCKGEDTTGPGPQHTTPRSTTYIICYLNSILQASSPAKPRGTGQCWAAKESLVTTKKKKTEARAEMPRRDFCCYLPWSMIQLSSKIIFPLKTSI